MRLFGKKPLYHSIVSTLLKSPFIDHVIINTDSEIIKTDALKNFSEVIIHDRPKEIQGDFVAMNEIINYDLQHSTEAYFIQTHSTNPLLTVETINKAIEKFFANLPIYDSLFSVTKLQTRLYWQNGEAINHNPKELLRTQDLPPVFEENSNFYIFSKKSFADSGNKRIGIKPLMFEVNKNEAIDIDTQEDFILAEKLLNI